MKYAKFNLIKNTKILLSNNNYIIDTKIKDNNGNTALQIAEMNHNHKISNMIKEYEINAALYFKL